MLPAAAIPRCIMLLTAAKLRIGFNNNSMAPTIEVNPPAVICVKCEMAK